MPQPTIDPLDNRSSRGRWLVAAIIALALTLAVIGGRYTRWSKAPPTSQPFDFGFE